MSGHPPPGPAHPPADARAVEIRQRAYTHPDVEALVAQVQAEYVVRYGGPDETPLDPSVFDPPAGAFFVGYADGRPVAMGGWRFRGDVTPFGLSRVTEIKRMYVVPAARRRGLARQVLRHLEATARAAGAEAMVLETGIEQPEALALYAEAGYSAVPAFGHYTWSPKSRHLGRRLGRRLGDDAG